MDVAESELGVPTETPQLASSADVARAAEAATATGRIGVDTEFISEGRYRPLLCLVQVAVAEAEEFDVVLIDTLAGDDQLGSIAAVLADPEIEVVVHAGRQDVAILRRVCQTEVRNLFDTQIAGGFAGSSAQTGYGNLVAAMLGERVGKTASYTRWDTRPLSAEQLRYAAEDVAHLLPLADELKRRLRESGRLDWALEECRRLETASDERDPESAWERLPRINQLDPRSRAVARALAAWRERSAASGDRPVSSVLADQVLVEIARRKPQTVEQLSHIRGVHRSTLNRRGSDIFDAVALGLSDPPIPRERTRPRSDSADGPIISLAEAWLRARALEAGVAYELLASRAELEALVGAARRREPEPAVRTLAGWRGQLVGSELRDLVAGRRALAVGDGLRLKLVEEP